MPSFSAPIQFVELSASAALKGLVSSSSLLIPDDVSRCVLPESLSDVILLSSGDSLQKICQGPAILLHVIDELAPATNPITPDQTDFSAAFSTCYLKEGDDQGQYDEPL